jgi:ADP-ribose pyrophosphatase
MSDSSKIGGLLPFRRRTIFKGKVVDLGLESFELPNGQSVVLEVIRHPGAAAVVPLHADGTVTLVRQYRHAGGGMMLEIPAGLLDPGEVPELGARRELTEETGLVCERLRRLVILHTTPGFTDEQIWIFLASGLTGSAEDMDLDDDEYLRPERLQLTEALELIDRGQITDGKTIVGLHLAARHGG